MDKNRLYVFKLLFDIEGPPGFENWVAETFCHCGSTVFYWDIDEHPPIVRCHRCGTKRAKKKKEEKEEEVLH